jgi:prevent-host-death family protein
MVKRMSVREARANFADVLGTVYYAKEPVIVEKKGKPVAVVVSPEQFERIRKEEREDLWAVVDRIRERNADKDPDEVYQDITALVEEVHQELYEKEQAKKSSRRR